MNTETRILEPGHIEPPLGQIPYLLLPPADLFARRAGRLRELAHGHPLEGYLAFLADICQEQQEALQRFTALPLPGAEQRALCRDHNMPLLGARTHTRAPVWREGLSSILRSLSRSDLPAPARQAVASLTGADAAGIEERADRILSGDLAAIAPRELPLIAAALQAYWVALARSLGQQAFGRSPEAGVCPVCGSLAVAGVVQSGGAENGLRYLSCSLCSAQWHLVRVTCSSCTSNSSLSYFMQEGSSGAVKAESCDDCGSYLKLLYLEKDGQMDPVADDLATLPLDHMMHYMERTCAGLNLLFHPGSGD